MAIHPMANDIHVVNKAHCYRRLVSDANSSCVNGCKFCYMIKYKGMVKEEPIDLNIVREQLTAGPTKRLLDKYKFVRIGSFGDLKIGDKDSYQNCIELMEMIHAYGYNYMLITKSCHSITDFMLDLIKSHNASLSVTMAYYTQTNSKRFEDTTMVPPEGRRRLVEKAIKRGINFTLRLNPMHPDYLSEHTKVVEWFASVGGERVILETLRILGTWKSNMPTVKFDKYVSENNGGIYGGYLTPSRATQNNMMHTMISACRVHNIEKVTICGDMEFQDEYGYGLDKSDCCQICDMYPGSLLPPRDWDPDTDLIPSDSTPNNTIINNTVSSNDNTVPIKTKKSKKHKNK